jgi:hypothetical protein
MKNIKIIAIAMITLFLIVACSESTTPTKDPNVNIIGELATEYVNMIEMGKNDNQIQNNEVDSIKILRVRILMSRMMLFFVNDNSTTGETVKLEPFVYDLNLTGEISNMGNSDVPYGMYDKLKIEIHRFSTSELDQYANDPIFKDFATQDRNTILIEGITYKEGNPSTFVFKSDAVANLSLKFEPALELKNNTKTTLAVQVDPNFFFKKWESILDPADSKNKNDIENSLMNTIRALKK